VQVGQFVGTNPTLGNRNSAKNRKFRKLNSGRLLAFSRRAGMGVDAADIDDDGWLDVYVTDLKFELCRLYPNYHDESFDDATFSSGMGSKATLPSGVSTKMFDSAG
jgi:hypothetical protein